MLVGLGVLVVALAAVVAVTVLDGDDAPRACSRTAEAPTGGTVRTVAQGAQLAVDVMVQVQHVYKLVSRPPSSGRLMPVMYAAAGLAPNNPDA